MKIIFLDINGVLNTDSYIEEQIRKNNGEFRYGMQFNFDPRAMKNLKDIIDKTDSYIVITSTWRYGSKESGDEYWTNLLRNFEEYDLKERIIGVTPFDYGESVLLSREVEIAMWLDENLYRNIENLAIVDDSTCVTGPLGRHLVKCDSCYGITEDVKERALEILK